MVEFLMAVDRVIDGNAFLRQVAESRFGGPMSDAWDLTPIENNLGIFSAKIEVINQRFRGETAIVTFQEGDNVPLVRVRFDLTNEGWQLHPVVPPKAANVELEKLAGILADITGSIERGSDFEEYVNAFIYRMLPQMGRVLAARDEA